MRIDLREKEIEDLKILQQKYKTDQRKSDRIKAILMLNDRYSAEETGSVLMVNINTITGWKKRYLNGRNGLDCLLNRYEGYLGKLTEKKEEIITDYVSQNIISDSKQVQQFIKNQFEIDYSRTGVKELLHRLGFTYKQTTLIPAKYNPEKQAAFKEAYDEFVPNLKEDETLVFMDGVHPQHNTKCSHAWIKVGEEKRIKSNSGRNRITISGAYNPDTQDIIFTEVKKTLKGETLIPHLQKIEAYYPNKATIYS